MIKRHSKSLMKPRYRPAFTREQSKLLTKHLMEKRDLELHLWGALVSHTALRSDQLTNLQWDHIHQNDKITIDGNDYIQIVAYDFKFNTVKRVYVDHDVMYLLYTWWYNNPQNKKYVFFKGNTLSSLRAKLFTRKMTERFVQCLPVIKKQSTDEQYRYFESRPYMTLRRTAITRLIYEKYLSLREVALLLDLPEMVLEHVKC